MNDGCVHLRVHSFVVVDVFVRARMLGLPEARRLHACRCKAIIFGDDGNKCGTG
jgi:hypothetical protein